MRRVFRIPGLRGRLEREVDDEIAFHIQTRIDHLVARGMSPDDARRVALRQFGDVEPVRRDIVELDRAIARAADRVSALRDAGQDLRFGLRTFRRNVAFTVLVVGGLTLGIGANAAIYSLIDALILRQLPVREPDRLVLVGRQENVTSSGSGAPLTILLSYPLYRDIRDKNRVFDGLLATGSAGRLDVRTEDGDDVERPSGRFVSGNYFTVLGVPAAIGTTIGTSDDQMGAPLRVTISHGYWTRRFQRDSSVVGREIRVDGIGATITGVAAPGFEGEVIGLPTDIWLPIASHDLLRPNDRVLRTRRASWLLLIGRTKPGLTIDQVRRELAPLIRTTIYANATPRDLDFLARRPMQFYISSAARGASEARVMFRAPLVALMAGVAILLCIVCVNVANLLLARGVARRREMLLRLAIGADRWRIVRQLLTENLLLAGVSAATAVIGGWWASRMLVMIAAEDAPLSLAVQPNPRVMLFTVSLSVGSVLLFGLLPALRSSRIDLATALRASARSISSGRFGLPLIVGQVALSLVLLASAVTLARSLRAMESRDLGLDRDHLLSVDLDIGQPRYTGARLTTVVRALRDRIAATPGVVGVTYSNNGLFTGTDWSTEVHVPGFAARDPDDSVVAADWIGPDYARALGARLIAGRDFNSADETTLAPTMLVNESFARFYFPGKSAVGRFVEIDRQNVEIVGVVADARSGSLEEPKGHYARRTYRAFLQGIPPDSIPSVTDLRLLVRTGGDPASTFGMIRRAVSSVDPALPIASVKPLTQLVRASIREERLVARIAMALGCLAMLLAALGLYGVLSYAIARRTNEIGVRMALGASERQIAQSILRGGLLPVAVGLMVGAPLALLAMRVLRSSLADIATADFTSIGLGAVILMVSAVVATAVPTRHAMKIGPLAALRED